jgi:hypothetical protein
MYGKKKNELATVKKEISKAWMDEEHQKICCKLVITNVDS